MTFQIKRLALPGVDEEIFTVSQAPVWVDGVWECGDLRFLDMDQKGFEPVPEIPVVITPESPASIRVSPVEFKLLFTSPERILLKSKKTTDPVVEDFYELIDDPRLTYVELTLPVVQYALAHFTDQHYLVEGRKEAITAGQMPTF